MAVSYFHRCHFCFMNIKHSLALFIPNIKCLVNLELSWFPILDHEFGIHCTQVRCTGLMLGIVGHFRIKVKVTLILQMFPHVPQYKVSSP